MPRGKTSTAAAQANAVMDRHPDCSSGSSGTMSVFNRTRDGLAGVLPAHECWGRFSQSAHSGPVARGSFVQTLVLTDIATGWTRSASTNPGDGSFQPSNVRTGTLRLIAAEGADRSRRPRSAQRRCPSAPDARTPVL
jgi:hypothetical protein